MTRDDIIRMAQQTGYTEAWITNTPNWLFIVKFAALVAAAEREACAKVCERLPKTFRIVAEEFGYKAEMPTAENYAAAIRTRSDE
jgi:hypothetical protein